MQGDEQKIGCHKSCSYIFNPAVLQPQQSIPPQLHFQSCSYSSPYHPIPLSMCLSVSSPELTAFFCGVPASDADPVIEHLEFAGLGEISVREGYSKEPGDFGAWLRTSVQDGVPIREKCEPSIRKV